MRTTAITVLFLGLSGYVMAALRARHVFGITATVYTAYNIGIIGAILCLQGRLGVYSAALGVAVGSALMLLVQLPSYLRHIGPPALRLRPDRELLASLVAFVPLSLFTLGRHAQVYIERFLGSSLDPGAISHLELRGQGRPSADGAREHGRRRRLPQPRPHGVSGRVKDLRLMIHRYARVIAVLILPAMAFLIVAASEMVGRSSSGAPSAPPTQRDGLHPAGLCARPARPVDGQHRRPPAVLHPASPGDGLAPARAAADRARRHGRREPAALPLLGVQAWRRGTLLGSPSWHSCCCAGPQARRPRGGGPGGHRGARAPRLVAAAPLRPYAIALLQFLAVRTAALLACASELCSWACCTWRRGACSVSARSRS